MGISLHPSTASPATSTLNKAIAHSQMRTTKSQQVALHLPYLWCEQRSTPEPLQPARRLFSASSRRRFGPGKERDYGDLFPLLSFCSPSPFAPSPSSSTPRVLSSLSSSGVWKQFRRYVGQGGQRGAGGGHRAPAERLAAP